MLPGVFGRSLRRKPQQAITQPGVQNPHCEPFPSAIALWISWKEVLLPPKPSVVRIWQLLQDDRSLRQALIGIGNGDEEFGEVKRTVQAPQPPS